jgi:GntR family transcriptional regulator/MocR family aminotransferase
MPRSKPLRQQVYERLREAIAHGALKPGTRLPPSREHAQVLGVSRNTVLWAVERLQFEGYLGARVGDGTYVSEQATGFSAGAGKRAGNVPPGDADLSQRGRRIARTEVSWGPRAMEATAFRIGVPALEAYPFALWERLARQTPAHMRLETASYQHPAGHVPLRKAIAEFLAVSRGISCTAEQVMVTTGSQQAIDLVCRLLLDEGDEVLVEDPGYLGIRANLVAQGAVVRGVPVDGEGLAVAQALQHARARLTIVTPTHQFPTGVTMSLGRRLALIEWAAQRRGWIVEDDYDGEFQYGELGMPALCSIDRTGRVLYAGTFSKILHPGLRLGYLVLPQGLVDAFARAKAVVDRHSPGAPQDVLARFISEGHMIKHLRAMRELYRARQAVLIDALRRATGGAVVLPPSSAGMHLCLETGPDFDDVALTRQARAAGVELAPLSLMAMHARRRGWAIGYSGFDEPTLRAAARKVGRLLAAAVEAGSPHHRVRAGRSGKALAEGER